MYWHFFLPLSFSLSVSLSLFLSLSLSLSFSLSICIAVSLSTTYWFILLPMHLYVCVSVFLSIYLSTYLFVCLFVCLCVNRLLQRDVIIAAWARCPSLETLVFVWRSFLLHCCMTMWLPCFYATLFRCAVMPWSNVNFDMRRFGAVCCRWHVAILAVLFAWSLMSFFALISS